MSIFVQGNVVFVLYFISCDMTAFFRTASENMISYWWMKEIYSKLPYHYKKNLKDFYTGIYNIHILWPHALSIFILLVHPSMWTRLTSWWFTTFMAPAIKQKLHNVYEVKINDITLTCKSVHILRLRSWTASFIQRSLIYRCLYRSMTCL